MPSAPPRSARLRSRRVASVSFRGDSGLPASAGRRGARRRPLRRTFAGLGCRRRPLRFTVRRLSPSRLRLWLRRHADRFVKGCDLASRQIANSTALHARKLNGSVSHAYQPADGQPDCIEHSSYFAVTALAERDVQPYVAPGSAARLDRVEMRRAVPQHHAFRQQTQLLVRRRAEQAHRVFARNRVARMHQAVSKLAVRREQEQTGRVQVQPADRDPASMRRPGQTLENRRPLFGIVAGRNLARRLVIRNVAVRPRLSLQSNGATIDQDPFLPGDPVSETCASAIDAHAPIGDPTLDLSPRP